jgi:hypothetical protein
MPVFGGDHVSDDPILVQSEIVEGAQKLKMDIQRKYVPPLDGTKDEFDAVDQGIARDVAEILVKTYFGYAWRVVSEIKQGIVYFSIPDLMGPTLNFVIRLADYKDLTPAFIKECGGQLLERMHLPRGQIDMALMQNARENKHLFDFRDVKGSGS